MRTGKPARKRQLRQTVISSKAPKIGVYARLPAHGILVCKKCVKVCPDAIKSRPAELKSPLAFRTVGAETEDGGENVGTHSRYRKPSFGAWCCGFIFAGATGGPRHGGILVGQQDGGRGLQAADASLVEAGGPQEDACRPEQLVSADHSRSGTRRHLQLRRARHEVR